MNLLAVCRRVPDQLKGEDGQDLVEYGLLVTLLALIVMVAVLALGPLVSGLYLPIADIFP